jgi:hypothetical protein
LHMGLLGPCVLAMCQDESGREIVGSLVLKTASGL